MPQPAPKGPKPEPPPAPPRPPTWPMVAIPVHSSTAAPSSATRLPGECPACNLVVGTTPVLIVQSTAEAPLEALACTQCGVIRLA